MPTRIQRQQRITELLAARAVRSQQDLQDLLAGEGIDVTQATLSRDLQTLQAAKGPAGYMLAGEPLPSSNGVGELSRALGHELLKAECGGNLVVLRTLPGHANALAIQLDHADLPGCLGTIAGDDTIFVATRSPSIASETCGRLRSLAGHSTSPPGGKRAFRAGRRAAVTSRKHEDRIV